MARREFLIPRWIVLAVSWALGAVIVGLLTVGVLRSFARDDDQDAERIYRSAVNCLTVNAERADTILFVADAADDLAPGQGLDEIVKGTGARVLVFRRCERLKGVTPQILARARREVAALRAATPDP